MPLLCTQTEDYWGENNTNIEWVIVYTIIGDNNKISKFGIEVYIIVR